MIRRLLPRTLRARLTALIILSTAATLALSGVALYSALHNRLVGMSSYEMSATLAAMRTHLANVANVDDIPRKSDLWIDQLHGHQNLDLAIYDTDGRLRFATRGFVAPRPALGAPQTRVPASAAPAGATFSYLADDAPLRGGNPRTARIVVQYDGKNDHALLRAYAYTVVVIEVLAVVLTAALAYGIAMLGLSPLRRLVARAEQMSSSRLAQPLPELDTSGELKEMEHAFNAMLKRLDESFVRLSQFSSNLAHDMRTPLTNLLAEAQVALSKPRTADEYRDVIESSIDEYQRLSRMIEDMLFLARSDNAQSHLAIRTLDAAAQAERRRRLLRADGRGCRRAHRRARQGRGSGGRAALSPRAQQPDQQRAQSRAARLDDHDRMRASRRRGDDQRIGHGPRHRGAAPRTDLRAVLPRRSGAAQFGVRHGARPGDRALDHGKPRRHVRRRQRAARAHDVLAEVSRARGLIRRVSGASGGGPLARTRPGARAARLRSPAHQRATV
ncbi:sensor histidine kinase IrlS [Burkholderia pseudomallei]|nr:sensor histidine kinase IrlS [Burkholderia pseudomallei]